MLSKFPVKGQNVIQRSRLRVGRLLGKYRIERLISKGPFAAVYKAYDTIEGIHVALKIPHAHLMDDQFLEDFRKEVRLSARLDHPNILHIKNAGFIDGIFVVALPLGERTLADRLQRRIGLAKVLDFTEQALDALHYAHIHRIIHCDIKPENFILFPGDHLRLADFGIAKFALRTVEASGSGTIGYIAPEQAMGKPSFKSDVFSFGLLLYRMLSGFLPEWPFEWPPPGHERLDRRHLYPGLVQLVRRAIEVNPAKRFQDAEHMLDQFIRIRSRALAYSTQQQRRKKNNRITRDWKEMRNELFKRTYGRLLQTRHTCRRCGGPVSESMRACPWCGAQRKIHRAGTRFPARCPRCKRGIKLDWKYCPWCYGKGFRNVSTRAYTDIRYSARCSNPKCTRKVLMPFMHYCPWCLRSVKRKWKLPESNARCPSCGWGVLPAYWSRCPWCGKALKKSKG